MIVIGLTGSLGTGKTEVSRILAGLGAAVINADELGHELFRPGNPTYTEVVNAFGKSILKRNGVIDRKKLGSLVFADQAALKKLNRIMHPRIRELVRQRMEEYSRSGAKVVVLEAALLLEADWKPILDQLWVTTAPEITIAKRLKKSRGLSQNQVLARLKTQMPQREKIKWADVVIDTDCTIDQLRTRVKELWEGLPIKDQP
jgi:dephospho-CoA kinase